MSSNIRLATQADLARIYGTGGLLIGRPVRPEPEGKQQAEQAEPEPTSASKDS